MTFSNNRDDGGNLLVIGKWPIPAKALATMTIVVLGIGLAVAGGQIIIHDVLPTFWSSAAESEAELAKGVEAGQGHGDLFASDPWKKQYLPFYKTDRFLFALKFTHIHVFGISAIFIVMGSMVLFFNSSVKLRVWLIILPFIGILIDLASVWLKLFVHPLFFWLHIPGGILFSTVFFMDSVLAIKQMWLSG